MKRIGKHLAKRKQNSNRTQDNHVFFYWAIAANTINVLMEAVLARKFEVRGKIREPIIGFPKE
jgi:hypothetical protein